MAKYRKLPVEIDAIQFDFAPTTADAIIEMAGPENERDLTFDEEGIHIETLEGTMTGNEGDYIIRGVKGELYPCKPDVFKATYQQSKMTDLEEAAKPLIKFLNENGHPHMKVIVDTGGAEVVEGLKSIRTDEFIKD